MPRAVKHLLRILMVLALATPFTFSLAPAHASDDTPSSWNLADYTMHAKVDADGNADVTLDIAFDFANDAGHGPFIALPERQPQPKDPDHWREMQLKVKGVTSSTGANTAIKTETSNNHKVLRIGTSGQKYKGVQRYQVKYTMHGVTVPDHPDSQLDEINWNAVGPAWQIPIKRATVVLEGPGVPTGSKCWTGKKFDQPCQAETSGNTVTYRASGLKKETGVQVVAGYPVGTFTPQANAVLSKRYHLGNVMPVTPLTGGVTGVLSLAGVAAVAARVRRHGRDEVYAGLTPGLSPVGGEAAPTTLRRGRTPIAVQFTPPADARPGELGTLIDEKADSRDVTGTLIDLAVRRHLRIDQQEEKVWQFTRLENNEPLAEYERKLLDKLFRKGGTVTTEQLKDAKYADLISKSQTRLYERVTERGWFKQNPQTVRLATVGVGAALIVVGAGLGLLLGFTAGFGLVGVAGVVTGLAVIAASGAMPRRTPEGSAMLAQTKGFEQYLATAEADQIKFEEGVDIFSRYLPYAIVFGVAERWTKLFEELAKQGLYQADTYWYGSPYGMGFYYGGFGSAMDSLTSAMESSIAASTAAAAGSSGGSGFSGGGGFGGGGGGGW